MSIANAKCILIIGATSGIGRHLALALAALPSRPTVIAAGRRVERLAELEGRGLKTVRMDVAGERGEVEGRVREVVGGYPELDAVVFASGIQYQFDFTKPEAVNIGTAVKEFNVNYIAVVSLISLFLPHFLKLSEQGRPSFIIPITSGLALMPKPDVPNYSASKAALRSFTISLRTQLKDTHVKVVEILPPLVESELHDEQGTTAMLSKHWMPLDEYTEKTMAGLLNGDEQVAVGLAATVLNRFEGLDMPWPVGKLD